MLDLERQALSNMDRDELDFDKLHPPKDCVGCPLCNGALIISNEQERLERQDILRKKANKRQAEMMGIRVEALEQRLDEERKQEMQAELQEIQAAVAANVEE